jgi:hypothetical protein
MQLKKALAFAAITIAFSSPAFAQVNLTMHDGRVSLVAKDATLRQILAEWARVGQTNIVNGDRVPGGPLTLQLTNVPEDQALDTILRPLTGYVAAPRTAAAPNQSQFDRIVVVPTIAPAAAPVSASAGPPPPAYPQPGMPTPFMQPGQPQPIPGMTDDQEDDRPANVPRGPVFNTFPPPQVVAPQPQPYAYPNTPGVAPPTQAPLMLPQPTTGNPNMGPQAAPYPGAPTAVPPGVAQPGMIAQPPQPGQVKRPGPGGQN